MHNIFKICVVVKLSMDGNERSVNALQENAKTVTDLRNTYVICG